MATQSTVTTSTLVLATMTTATAVLVLACRYWTQSKRAPKDTDITPKQTLALIRRRRSIFPKHYSTSARVDGNVLNDMLEAATWAPSHHLTEPWHFIIFHEDHNRHLLGKFLAEQYKHLSGDSFVAKKYEKKIQNCRKASHIIGICCSLSNKNPAMEDVCSVAAAVQNMHLVATSHGVGAYWSTSGIYATNNSQNSSNKLISLENPPALRKFLKLKDEDVCLGWMFVGPFDGKWPTGRRKPCRVQEWVSV